jgi:hypothetical protein
MTEAKPFEPTPHPLLPLPSSAEVELIASRPGGIEELARFYAQRERRIKQANEDPYHYGLEPEIVEPDGTVIRPWADVDALLAQDDVEIVALWGGNRSTKSNYAAKRINQNAERYGNSTFICLTEKEETSIATQQKLFWEYFPPRFKALNGRRDPRHVFSINYNPKTGFADRKIVLPNRSEIYFLMYQQVPTDYEGWEFGSKEDPILCIWADESLPLDWLLLFSRRLKFRRGKMVWPFTPVRGVTPTVQEFRGAAPITLRSFPAELLPKANYPGCPKGHMPYIQIPFFAKSRAVYFHTRFNSFTTTGGRSYYDQVKELCEGKEETFIERIAYGVARNTIAVALPRFGVWNVIKEPSLPAVGTNYQLTDPHGARNWASIWVRVSADNPPEIYIYRDWPDEQRYGAWAIASSKPGTFDGDIGPAQQSLGYGVSKFKETFLTAEKISPVIGGGQIADQDPQHRRALEKLLAKGGWRAAPYPPAAADSLKTVDLSEGICARFIDPRAGRNPHAEESGGTCLIDQFAEEQRDRKSDVVTGPRMIFLPWSGVEERFGLTAINTLLEFDHDQPLVPLLNAPRLFVADRCRQVIWAMSTYTGRDGTTAACKDFIDLVRAAALAPLRHITREQMTTRGGGSY